MRHSSIRFQVTDTGITDTGITDITGITDTGVTDTVTGVTDTDMVIGVTDITDMDITGVAVLCSDTTDTPPTAPDTDTLRTVVMDTGMGPPMDTVIGGR